MHPTKQELLDLVDGKLSEEAMHAVSNHLETCEQCNRQVVEIESDGQRMLLPNHSDDLDVYTNEDACQQLLETVPKLLEPRSESSVTQEPFEPFEIGDYQVEALIKHGGMGSVFRAIHKRLNRAVAIKLLPTSLIPDHQAIARFKREMQAIGSLVHPNVVIAHDAGEVDGRYYLVMELLEGRDLSWCSSKLGPMPMAEACEIVRQAAIGLEYVHQQGMIHRDIKPSNLMLVKSTRDAQDSTTAVVKILDLGLARLDSSSIASNGVTSTGQCVGTIEYMAPEQAVNSRDVDIRADVYGLGATLFRCLAGHAPRTVSAGASPLELLQMMAEPATKITSIRQDVPASLSELIERAMAQHPADRFSSPAELAEALAPFTVGHDLAKLYRQAMTMTSSASSDPPTTRPGKRSTRVNDDKTRVSGVHRKWVLVGCMLLMAIFAVFEIDRYYNRSDKTKNAPSENARSQDVQHELSVASAVFELGGHVLVDKHGSDEDLPVYQVSDLPDEFRIHWIELSPPARSSLVDDDWIKRHHLAKLPSLTGIGMAHSNISDDGLRYLAKANGLRFIMIYGTPVTDVGLHAISQLQLLEINIGSTRVSDDGLIHLRNQHSLEFFAASSAKIGNSGLRHLSSLPSLNTLYLDGTMITNGGLSELTKLASLSELDLSDTSVTDDGLASLERLTRLRKLHLRESRVSAAGIARLRQTLHQCEILTTQQE